MFVSSAAPMSKHDNAQPQQLITNHPARPENIILTWMTGCENRTMTTPAVQAKVILQLSIFESGKTIHLRWHFTQVPKDSFKTKDCEHEYQMLS